MKGSDMPRPTLLSLSALGLFIFGGLAVNPSARAAEAYAADPVHSSLVYRVKHFNATYFWGRFNTINGSFSLDDANPANCQFEFQVKADSIDTGNAKRDKHLKSPDFFNVVQFPTIAFKSQSVTRSGEAYEVVGDLTMHGVTKPITVKVVPTGKGKGPMGAPIAGIEATLLLKRTDFGMSNMVGPLGDDVWVTVSIEGRRK
jgi:polyisoprenoid-binding protein YceI